MAICGKEKQENKESVLSLVIWIERRYAHCKHTLREQASGRFGLWDSIVVEWKEDLKKHGLEITRRILIY